MLIITTPNIEGKQIKRYFGIVSGEAILGANIFRDVLARITDIAGGRSGAYVKEFREVKNIALQEMSMQAQQMGANAVVSVDLDYETIGQSMLMVSASGTAVYFE